MIRTERPRRGTYRIVYQIDDSTRVVHVLDIDHLMISEVHSLPEPDREVTLAAQRDYVAELVQLLRQVHPALPLARAHVQVQAALMIANDVARSPHLREQIASTEAVAALCDQILGLPQAS